VKKTLPVWAFGVLSVVGAVLAASMLFHWIDVGGEYQQRGLSLAWDDHWLLLVPIAGCALVAAAATRSEYTRLAAIFAGTVVAGDVLFEVATSMIHSGLDTWLILGGAGAMLAGAAPRRAMWRALGGIAVLAGFFAPWAYVSMFDMLRSDMGELTGFTFRVLWLVPLAGITGVISAGNQVTGARLAAGAGIAVYGALLWVIGSAACYVFGLGAWAALGASTIALVVGVLARTPVAAPKPAQLDA
jgi:hypothetical protein